MVAWYQVLQLADSEGKGTGRYRYVHWTDEPFAGYHPLCDCDKGHGTIDEASNCEKAQKHLPSEMQPRTPEQRLTKKIEKVISFYKWARPGAMISVDVKLKMPSGYESVIKHFGDLL